MKPEAPEQQRILVGQLSGVFGVKGWLKVKSFTQPESNILTYSPWYLKTPFGLKVVEVAESKQRPQGLVVRLEGYDDRDESALIGRSKIEVDAKQLPSLDEGDFYWHQLEGLEVISEYEGKAINLGVVKGLMETGANDVIIVAPSVASLDDRERMVPYVMGQYVSAVDLQQGLIRVIWDPEF